MTDQHNGSRSENADELLEALASVLEQGRSIRIAPGDVGLLEALGDPDLGLSATAGLELHRLAEHLDEIVQRDRRFPGDVVRMVRGQGGATGFYPHFVGGPLVLRVLKSEDPGEAIRWLQKVLETPGANGQSITAVWGVPVEQRSQIAPGIEIVPIDDLPESPQKRWIAELLTEGPRGLVKSGLDFDPPTSALVMRQRIEPFLYTPGNEPEPTNQQFIATHELLSEIILALTVVGPRVPLQAANWFTFDDPDLEQALIGAGRHHQHIEILPASHRQYPPLDLTEARDIVGGYLALQGSTRNQVRVALQRLNQAQRRHNLGDRAVELSTALETLMGDKATTEMTHKIRVRSVRLIGGGAEIRKKNASVVTETYKIRSSLVHTGQVNTTGTRAIQGQQMTPSEIIEHSTAMCVDLIKLIVHRGLIPDWSEFDITEQTI